MSAIFDFISKSDLLIVFLIGVIGYAVGGIKIKGIEVGTAGVLLVALVFGHFGFALKAQSLVNDLGLALFVGSVGFIAGPKFFRDLKRNFKSYVVIGLVVILSGSIVCIISIKAGGLPSSLAAGCMTGALTSTPGLAAAKEAAAAAATTAANAQGLVGDAFNAAVSAAEGNAATGYGIAYVFGVIGVVLFVQIVPKVLKVNMKEEAASLSAANQSEPKVYKGKLFDLDPMGMFALCFGITCGYLIGKITIPLPGGASFSLGTSGGPLIAGLIFGHFGHLGPVNITIEKKVLEVFREFGLMLFLIAAGIKGGNGFVSTLQHYGVMLFVWGALMTAVPMFIGFFLAKYLLKLCLLNNLGSITGGMTSTPALGTLISVAGTDDVATAYASTYPIALVCVVLASQFIVILFA